MVMLLLVILHVLTPFHVPPKVEAHVEPLTVPPTAYTLCVEARRISTAIDRMISSFRGPDDLRSSMKSTRE